MPFKEKNDFGEEIDKENLEKWLNSNLKAIPYKYKEVLTLYYFEELSYKEISDVLLIPTSTVGIRIKRAKELLKKIYNKK
jgi:RNA polymerase sigma-70 factor (ECF subfamily)